MFALDWNKVLPELKKYIGSQPNFNPKTLEGLRLPDFVRKEIGLATTGLGPATNPNPPPAATPPTGYAPRGMLDVERWSPAYLTAAAAAGGAAQPPSGNASGFSSQKGTGVRPGRSTNPNNLPNLVQFHLMDDPASVARAKNRYNSEMQLAAARGQGQPISMTGTGPEGSGFAVGGGAAGGYGGRGGGLADEYQQALDKANQANENRYHDVLQGYDQRHNRGMDMLQNSAAQEVQDINQMFDAARGRINQDLVSRGLRSSSIAGAMDLGNEKQRTDAVGRVADRERRLALETDAQLSGDTLQFMERKNEVAPDFAQLIALSQLLGQGGVGAGGALGGGAMLPVAGNAGMGNPGYGGGGFTSPVGYMPRTNSRGGGLTSSQLTHALKRSAEQVKRASRKTDASLGWRYPGIPASHLPSGVGDAMMAKWDPPLVLRGPALAGGFF